MKNIDLDKPVPRGRRTKRVITAEDIDGIFAGEADGSSRDDGSSSSSSSSNSNRNRNENRNGNGNGNVDSTVDLGDSFGGEMGKRGMWMRCRRREALRLRS